MLVKFKSEDRENGWHFFDKVDYIEYAEFSVDSYDWDIREEHKTEHLPLRGDLIINPFEVVLRRRESKTQRTFLGEMKLQFSIGKAKTIVFVGDVYICDDTGKTLQKIVA